jgi:large subunit ribosomal protein L24
MNIKKDDNIIVITGKDKGKTGKVLKAFPRLNKIVVSGVNIKKVHKRPTKSGQKGQIVDKSLPIDASNVKLANSKAA